jgi:hypothetical protein
LWLALQLALCTLMMCWAVPLLWTLPLACPCPCRLQQAALCSSLQAPVLWAQEAPSPSPLVQAAAAAAAAAASSLCCLPPRRWLRLPPLLRCLQLQLQQLLPRAVALCSLAVAALPLLALPVAPSASSLALLLELQLQQGPWPCQLAAQLRALEALWPSQLGSVEALALLGAQCCCRAAAPLQVVQEAL